MAPDRPDSPAENQDWTDAEIAAFMADEETQAALARADADIAAGRVVSHEKMVAWLKTWGTPESKPYPREWFE